MARSRAFHNVSSAWWQWFGDRTNLPMRADQTFSEFSSLLRAVRCQRWFFQFWGRVVVSSHNSWGIPIGESRHDKSISNVEKNMFLPTTLFRGWQAGRETSVAVVSRLMYTMQGFLVKNQRLWILLEYFWYRKKNEEITCLWNCITVSILLMRAKLICSLLSDGSTTALINQLSLLYRKMKLEKNKQRNNMNNTHTHTPAQARFWNNYLVAY